VSALHHARRPFAPIAALIVAAIGWVPQAQAQGATAPSSTAATPPLPPSTPPTAPQPAPAPRDTEAPTPATDATAASARDCVLLKDGTTIEGTIVSQEPGRYVVVQTSAGQQTIVWDDIRRVTQGTPPAVPPSQPPRAPAPFSPASPAVVDPPPEAASTADDVDLLWRRRGRSRFVLDVHGQGSWNDKAYRSATSFVTGRSRSIHAGGAGGGAGVYGAWMFGAAPRPSSPSGRWMAFEVGSGVDVSAVWLYNSQSIPQPGVKEVLTQVIVPFVVGGRFGFGSFKSDTRWRGAALGIAWSPQYAWYSNEAAQADSGGFSPLGAQASIDIASLHADAGGTDFAFRIFYRQTRGLGSIPNTGTGGFGLVWY
jgi:hypothetical protein